MFNLSLLCTLTALIRTQRTAIRRDNGSVSVEQVLITAGLVALAIAAGAAILAGMKKYAANI